MVRALPPGTGFRLEGRRIRMSWSTWGLTELDDGASDRTVLAGGGRVLSLDIDEHRTTQSERLGDRWSISVVELPATALPPRRGDIVIWRGLHPEDLTQPSVWHSPARVLSVEEGDRPGMAQVSMLHDAVLDDRDSEVDSEWLEEAVSDDGSVLSEEEAWAILGCWNLHPLCPRCGGTTRPYVYGLLGVDVADDRDFIVGGCVLDADMPAYNCVVCGHDF